MNETLERDFALKLAIKPIFDALLKCYDGFSPLGKNERLLTALPRVDHDINCALELWVRV